MFHIGRKSAVFAILCLFLAGCTKPISPDRSGYVGRWSGKDMSLTIRQGGKVTYRRKKGMSSTKIDAPLMKFEGNDFIVGFWKFKTAFVVSEPPHEENGVWKMTVNGVELTKK